MVGEVISVNTRVLTSLLENQFIPVIAPVGAGKKGESYTSMQIMWPGTLLGAEGQEADSLDGHPGCSGQAEQADLFHKVKEYPKLIEDGNDQGWHDPQGELLCRRPERRGEEGAHH